MTRTIALSSLVVVLSAGAAAARAQTYTPPPFSARAVAGVRFGDAAPVDEAYRAEFARCDRENVFRGRTLVSPYRCSGDPSRVRALLRFPDGTIFFEAKLALDLDGSWLACHAAGPTDLCPTSLEWTTGPAAGKPIDSDRIPYVVIPASGPASLRREFRDKTGIAFGDVGVVVYGDSVVPVLVADGGPYNKLGEGSAALFRGIRPDPDPCRERRPDGNCQRFRQVSISSGVLFFVFPRSRIAGLTPDNALQRMREAAMAAWARLQTQPPE